MEVIGLTDNDIDTIHEIYIFDIYVTIDCVGRAQCDIIATWYSRLQRYERITVLLIYRYIKYDYKPNSSLKIEM